jgi:hypothetical protein
VDFDLQPRNPFFFQINSSERFASPKNEALQLPVFPHCGIQAFTGTYFMARFREIVVRSLGELIDKSTPAEQDPVSGRFRNYSVYRGVSADPLSFLTTLDRLGGWENPHSKAHLEEHIFRNFIRYARPFLKSAPLNDWELLVAAQHHGLPTRLLDWTYSPLVAAHFATLIGSSNADRFIWKLDWKVMHGHFGLKPLAFLVSDLDEALKEKGYDSIWDLIGGSASDQTKKKQGEAFICMLEPPALDSRLLAQAAAFTFCSDKRCTFADILERSGLCDCLSKFIIPADRVDFFRDQLDLSSVDERRLFPDLDGIAAEIKRYYSSSAEKD